MQIDLRKGMFYSGLAVKAGLLVTGGSFRKSRKYLVLKNVR